jgi:hypothetical protein
MKLNDHQLEACAYIFEIDLGNDRLNFRQDIIESSGISNYSPNELEKSILQGLENGSFSDDDLRTSAYWALSKRFNRKLIPLFRKYLKYEMELKNTGPLFQLMVALNNIEEPVFSASRTGFAHFETELNLKDAELYLDEN